MTVTTEKARSFFDWTGVETSFSCGWPAETASHVFVSLKSTGGHEVQLVRGVHYSVTIAAGTRLVTITPLAFPFPGLLTAERRTPATVVEVLQDGQEYSLEVIQRLHDRAAMRSAEDRDVLTSYGGQIGAIAVQVDGHEVRLDEHQDHLYRHDIILDSLDQHGDTGLSLRAFSTRSEAMAYHPLVAPPHIRVEGYHAPADGGGFLARRVPADPGHTASFSITLADGATVVWYAMSFTPILTPEQFGARGFTDDVARGDDTAAIFSMTMHAPIGATVYLDKSYHVTAYQNWRALVFIGPGEIVTWAEANAPSIMAGLARLNWADDAHRDVVGEEYFYPMRKKLADAVAANRNISGFLYGDSTWATPSGIVFDYKNHPEYVFNIIATEIGLPGQINANNQAVGGTTEAQCFAGITKSGKTPVENLGPGNDFSFFKFGGLNAGIATNEGRPSSLFVKALEVIATYRAGFAAMRSHPYGTLNTHTIIMFGPNSANNIGFQDARWLRLVTRLLRQVCREFNVVYIDLFDRWADTYYSARRWMDGPYQDDGVTPAYGPLHPLDIHWATMWAAVKDVFRVALVTSQNRTNGFRNIPATMAVLPASARPSAYEPGDVWYEVTDSPVVHPAPADRWPASGMLESKVSGSGDIKTQILHIRSDGRSLTRRKQVGADEWGVWSGQLRDIYLTNGWKNFGAFNADATAILSSEGQVTIDGLLHDGADAAGTVIGLLPSGCAPSKEVRRLCGTYGGGGVIIRVSLSGQVVLESGTVAGWITLGFSYYI